MITSPLASSALPITDLGHYLEISEDGILLVGTKIALWQIVEAYEAGSAPEQIALNYQHVHLAQVYAAITYYLANQATFVRETEDTQADLVKHLRTVLDGRHQIRADESRVKLTAV